MEVNITENLVKVLIRQRDAAMSKCAELEAKLLSLGEKLAEFVPFRMKVRGPANLRFRNTVYKVTKG